MLPSAPCRVAALAYAERGWAILPLQSPHGAQCSCGHACGSAGKHPRSRHGVLDASRDPALIERWWQRWPEANVGIATGAPSGLVVVDVDVRHSGMPSLLALQRHYQPLPATLTAASGGGGWHLYFGLPTLSSVVRNATGLLGLPGLDVRGEAGYIVAAPSRHASGVSYRWLDAQMPLAPLPLWLCTLLAPRQGRHAPGRHALDRPATHDAGAFWLSRALSGVSVGRRNQVGYWLACRLRDAGVSEAEAEEVLRTYAAQVPSGHHPYTEREALSSLHSAYQEPGRAPVQREMRRPVSR